MNNIHIVHLEMLNVLVALILWGRHLEGKVVQIHCDIFAVVNVLNNGWGRDPYLLAIADNICMLSAHGYIKLQVVHIPGKCNIIADLLSLCFLNMNWLKFLPKCI